MFKAIAIALTTLASCLPTGRPADTAYCDHYKHALTVLAPAGGWNVDRMSQYMWRESRCTPTARSSTRDSGLLQINDVNLRYLARTFGHPVYASTLMDPVFNIRSAAVLCTYWRNVGSSCYRPWGG